MNRDDLTRFEIMGYRLAKLISNSKEFWPAALVEPAEELLLEWKKAGLPEDSDDNVSPWG